MILEKDKVYIGLTRDGKCVIGKYNETDKTLDKTLMYYPVNQDTVNFAPIFPMMESFPSFKVEDFYTFHELTMLKEGDILTEYNKIVGNVVTSSVLLT